MSDDDKVGYKNPPRHTRFKPGQSGNLYGRRGKPRSNVVTGLSAAINAKVTLREGKRERRVSKIAAIFYQLRQKALAGDASAYDMLMQHAAQCGLIAPGVHPDPAPARGGILLVPGVEPDVEKWRRESNANAIDYNEELAKLTGVPLPASIRAPETSK